MRLNSRQCWPVVSFPNAGWSRGFCQALVNLQPSHVKPFCHLFTASLNATFVPSAASLSMFHEMTAHPTNNSMQCLFDDTNSTTDPIADPVPPLSDDAAPAVSNQLRAGCAPRFHFPGTGRTCHSDRASCCGSRAGQTPQQHFSSFTKFVNTNCWCYWGLPLPGISPLSTTLQASFLVQSFSGRPITPVVVPFFVLTFSAQVMSVALFASGTASSIFGDSLDVTVANIVQPLALVNQPFVMGLGFSLVPTKLITQILVGKYILLSELLPANLQYKEPKLQLLFYS